MFLIISLLEIVISPLFFSTKATQRERLDVFKFQPQRLLTDPGIMEKVICEENKLSILILMILSVLRSCSAISNC